MGKENVFLERKHTEMMPMEEVPKKKMPMEERSIGGAAMEEVPMQGRHMEERPMEGVPIGRVPHGRLCPWKASFRHSSRLVQQPVFTSTNRDLGLWRLTFEIHFIG